jgi:hypothetical protein
MSQRAWPARATSATQGRQTDTPRPSAPAPPVAADGRPAEAPGSGPGTSQERPSRSRFTARGAALAMLALFLAGDLLAGWLSLTVLAGLTFVAGCLLAAIYTQRHDLLFTVTMPPVIFLVAVLGVQAVTSPGSTFVASAEAVAAGTVLTLAATAPWLFGGVLICLIVAMFRGLVQCVRDLGAGLRGEIVPADRAH